MDLIIFLIICILLSSSVSALTTDDIFKELKINDAVNTKAVFSLSNPTVETLNKNSLKISFNEVCGSVKSYKILYKDVCTKHVQTPVYKITEICDVSNSTAPCYEEKTIIDYTDEYINYECYKELKDIPTGQNDYKIEADIEMKKCSDGWGYKIDWLPEITINDGSISKTFKQDKWAWWNVTFTKRMLINCTNIDDNVPLVINGSNGFTIDGQKQIVWTYCTGTDTALYLKNSSDYTDYVVANDSGLIPFEVELGNGTSYNPSNVWDINYKLVYHLEELTGTNVTDSTANNNHGTMNIAINTGIGKYGKGYIIADNYITVALSGNTPHTVEMWFNNTNVGGDNGFLYGKNANANFRAWVEAGKAGNFNNYGTATTNAGAFANDLWRSILFSTNGTEGRTNKLYINSDLNKTAASTSTIYDYTWFFCGSAGTVYCDVYGVVDEIRVSDIERSADYANSTYQNALGTEGYGTLGAEETPAADSCTPPVTGNWNIEASDYCVWTENEDIPGNITITGIGAGDLYANFTFIGNNQFIYHHNGSSFNVHAGGGLNG